MGNLFNTFELITDEFANSFLRNFNREFVAPDYSISKNSDEVTTAELVLPGYSKSDISIQVETDTLTNLLIVSYTGEETKIKKKFNRKFNISKNVDTAKITADMQDGI